MQTDSTVYVLVVRHEACGSVPLLLLMVGQPAAAVLFAVLPLLEPR